MEEVSRMVETKALIEGFGFAPSCRALLLNVLAEHSSQAKLTKTSLVEESTSHRLLSQRNLKSTSQRED